MSDLVAAIDAFLAKYPDEAVLEWKEARRKPNPLDIVIADLTTAAERRDGLKP